jgi:hypothetical protein
MLLTTITAATTTTTAAAAAYYYYCCYYHNHLTTTTTTTTTFTRTDGGTSCSIQIIKQTHLKQNKINYTVHHKQAQHGQFSTVTIVQSANCLNKLTAT